VPALLTIQPGWALLLGGLILIVAGLVLLWLAQPQSDVSQHFLTALPSPSHLTFAPLLTDEPLLVASQPAMALDVPHCYDTAVDGLLCLGLLKNTTTHLWKNLSLTLQLGTHSQHITLEQAYLLPGQSAPYRVLWPASSVREEKAAPLVLLPTGNAVDDAISPISVQQINGFWVSTGRYRVTALLQNPSDQTLTQGQIVVTLLDSDGAVVGYRLRDLPRLTPGSSSAFLIDLVPVVKDGALTPQITALAWSR